MAHLIAKSIFAELMSFRGDDISQLLLITLALLLEKEFQRKCERPLFT